MHCWPLMRAPRHRSCRQLPLNYWFAGADYSHSGTDAAKGSIQARSAAEQNRKKKRQVLERRLFGLIDTAKKENSFNCKPSRLIIQLKTELKK